MCAIVTCKETNGHKIESADTVANSKRQIIRDQKVKMEDVGKQIQSVTNDVKAEQEMVSKLRKTVEDEIDKTFDSLEQIISRGRADLKKTLEDDVMVKQDNLKIQDADLKRMRSEIEESSKFTDQALAYTNAPAFLQVQLLVVLLKQLGRLGGKLIPIRSNLNFILDLFSAITCIYY